MARIEVRLLEKKTDDASFSQANIGGELFYLDVIQPPKLAGTSWIRYGCAQQIANEPGCPAFISCPGGRGSCRAISMRQYHIVECGLTKIAILLFKALPAMDTESQR